MADTSVRRRWNALRISGASPVPRTLPRTKKRPAATPATNEQETTARRSKRVARRVSLAGVNPKWRDWAGLTALLADSVGDRLLNDDVADFLRFRMVCKLWKKPNDSGIDQQDPRELGAVIDHRFHPRRWILLTEPAPAAMPTRRKLLNVTTRKIITVDLPELAGYTVVPGPAAAPEGMLVLRDGITLVVRLLNPLTRHFVNLPSLRTLQPGGSRWGPIPHTFRVSHEVTAAGFADASTVVVYFGRINQMAVSKPGDEVWTPVGGLSPEFPLRCTATFDGRFYCVDRTDLLVVDLEQRPGPQLVFAADMERQFRTVSLVDDGGSLMAVCSRRQVVRLDARSSSVETRIELFHVDLEEETLSLPILDLGERAILTGSRGAVLLPKTNYYFSVRRGTVYFRFASTQRHFGAFHVRRRYMGYIAAWGGRLAEHVASYATAGIE